MAFIGRTPTPVPLTSSDITDDIISLAKMAGGTDGNIITYDASGNPAVVATGNDGQVLTSTGAGSAPAFETISAGKILQVVQDGHSYQKTHSGNTSYVTVESSSGTVWEPTITPSATSSKILILASLHFASYENGGGGSGKHYLKMSGQIGSGSYAALRESEGGVHDYGGSGVAFHNNMIITYLWSPSTTSACKVKFEMRTTTSGSSVVCSYAGFPTYIHLFEVGA